MAKKKLIIVYDKNTEATANYLLQLISGTDDVEGAQVGTRDGNVDANIWSEKEYSNNRPKLSSAQYVLFVGNNKTVRTLRENVTDTFCECGMHYGWLGTQAFMYVEPAAITKDNYAQFEELSKKYSKEFSAKCNLQYTAKDNAFIGFFKRVGDFFQSKEIEKRQYALLAMIMYIDGLTAFLAEE